MPDRIVYSTDPAWKPPCPACGGSPCVCAPAGAKPKQAEPVRVSFRRGHKDSGMTIIEKLRLHPAGKEELLKKFKKRLGVGGTVKMGALELQGDHLDQVEIELKSLGYKVKKPG